MAELERLFSEFVGADLAGEAPDPVEYIGRLDGPEREELAELIDAYYVDAPPRKWDADAFRGSDAEHLADEIDRAFRGRSGLWPAILPRLRHRAHLKRGELVAKLADALGVGDRAEKVGSYYHEMEQGLLPAQGVTNQVLEALGGLLDTSAETLRRAGRSLAEDVSPADTEAVFTRTSKPDAHFDFAFEEPTKAKGIVPEPDEVDELFTGHQEAS